LVVEINTHPPYSTRNEGRNKMKNEKRERKENDEKKNT
jgi:hypothetical protein